MTRTSGFKFRVLSVLQNSVMLYQTDEEMQTTSESQAFSWGNNFFVQLMNMKYLIALWVKETQRNTAR